MRFTNVTGLPANWTLGFQRDGRELLVVIVKGTYTVVPGQGETVSAREQVPLVEADQFTGAPGESAPLCETDFAHTKPACDVIVMASACAPRGRLVRRMTIGIQAGRLVKQFSVVGPRRWRSVLGMAVASDPEPFDRIPLTYDVAFGGTDTTRSKEGSTATYERNPVGRGYWRYGEKTEGGPLSNTEELDRPVQDPAGDYAPMALSPVGRNWLPRRLYAGTYDAHWIRTTAPLWPDDFDERYFQCAPPDQQMPFPEGGESVLLRNLRPDGDWALRLPKVDMPIVFIPHRGRDHTVQARVDTLVMEPEADRLTLTWRASLPLGRSVFDIKETVVGDHAHAQRQRSFPGKTYYRNLGDAVRAKGRGP